MVLQSNKEISSQKVWKTLSSRVLDTQDKLLTSYYNILYTHFTNQKSGKNLFFKPFPSARSD